MLNKAILKCQQNLRQMLLKGYTMLAYRLKIGDLKKKSCLATILFRMRMKKLVAFLKLDYKAKFRELEETRVKEINLQKAQHLAALEEQ